MLKSWDRLHGLHLGLMGSKSRQSGKKKRRGRKGKSVKESANEKTEIARKKSPHSLAEKADS
jgi:hypothetical protein